MLNFDFYLLKKINTEWTHPILDTFFTSWTDIHKEPIIQLALLTALIVLGFKRNWKILKIIFLTFLLTTIADALADEIVKPLFLRPRPSSTDLPFDLIIRGKNVGGYSLPSSHATVAFTFAQFLSLQNLRWAPHYFCLAFLTGYSRIYCGIHFPSDILAGAIIGITVGLIGYRVEQDFLQFPKRQNGRP